MQSPKRPDDIHTCPIVNGKHHPTMNMVMWSTPNITYSSVSFNMDWRGIKFTNIRQPMLKLKTNSGFHDLFRF
jgi:hypothetical protein